MADNKFTYKEYEDDADTIAAKTAWDTISASKPGEFTYADYVQSDNVTNAYNQLQNLQKPGAYQSNWQQTLDDTMNKILNREKFSYDVTGDALYQQYKDQYVNQGKLAMMDTMGQAQAATGGYGNSYAQSVGQQAYHGYLQQLNDRVPELYQLALDKYNQEGAELYNQYGLFADRENTDYGRYRDSVSDYNTERGYLTDVYNTERSWDYGLYSDAYNRAYNQHRDSVSDWQYADSSAANNYWNAKNFGYGKYTDDKDFAYTEYRDGKEDEQTAKDNALREAETAASLGDFTKLQALGYDTTKAEEAYNASLAGGDDTASPLGGFSEKDFSAMMYEAFANGDEKYALALVSAAGKTNMAWEIYDEYFKKKQDDEPSNKGGSGGGGGSRIDVTHKE